MKNAANATAADSDIAMLRFSAAEESNVGAQRTTLSIFLPSHAHEDLETLKEGFALIEGEAILGGDDAQLLPAAITANCYSSLPRGSCHYAEMQSYYSYSTIIYFTKGGH